MDRGSRLAGGVGAVAARRQAATPRLDRRNPAAIVAAAGDCSSAGPDHAVRVSAQGPSSNDPLDRISRGRLLVFSATDPAAPAL
jgi:hypothetical protein